MKMVASMFLSVAAVPWETNDWRHGGYSSSSFSPPPPPPPLLLLLLHLLLLLFLFLLLLLWKRLLWLLGVVVGADKWGMTSTPVIYAGVSTSHGIISSNYLEINIQSTSSNCQSGLKHCCLLFILIIQRPLPYLTGGRHRPPAAST